MSPRLQDESQEVYGGSWTFGVIPGSGMWNPGTALLKSYRNKGDTKAQKAQVLTSWVISFISWQLI